MSRLAAKFTQLHQEGRKALMPYITAGDPDLQTTYEVALALEQSGADILELGIPFSDPMADGPTIQAAAQRALAGGTTFAGVLDTVRQLRRRSDLPIVFLVYYNAICRRGEEAFVAACAQSGVDGLVVPDLPLEQGASLRAIAKCHGIDVIQMLAPTSTATRIAQVAQVASGFIYCVSLMGVTGARQSLPPELAHFLQGVQAVTSIPLVVGFGISRPELAQQAAAYSDGVIVGSALIDVVARVSQDKGVEHAPRAAGEFMAPFRTALNSMTCSMPTRNHC